MVAKDLAAGHQLGSTGENQQESLTIELTSLPLVEGLPSSDMESDVLKGVESSRQFSFLFRPNTVDLGTFI